MVFDKETSAVGYNDELHLYVSKSDGGKFLSVTQLLGRYHQEFDKDFWSGYKALERCLDVDRWKAIRGVLLESRVISDWCLEGVDLVQYSAVREDVLAEWAEENRKGCERGDKIHAEQERLLLAGEHPKFNSFGDGVYDSDRFLDVKRGYFPELLLSYDDGFVRLAGQADLIIRDGWDIWVKDYKTNKKLEFQSFYDKRLRKRTSMLYPVNDLMDCNGVHYQLQLSLYAWMIQQMDSRFRVKGLTLIHFPHEGGEIEYDVDYLPDAVERVIAHYRKELKKSEMLDELNSWLDV